MGCSPPLYPYNVRPCHLINNKRVVCTPVRARVCACVCVCVGLCACWVAEWIMTLWHTDPGNNLEIVCHCWGLWQQKDIRLTYITKKHICACASSYSVFFCEKTKQKKKRLHKKSNKCSATRSSGDAKDTNSNQCKKHDGGGVPLIIHTEIDRRASPEATVWITYCLALRGDSAVDSGWEFVSIATRVRVQHERIRKRWYTETIPPTAFYAADSCAPPLRGFTLMHRCMNANSIHVVG